MSNKKVCLTGITGQTGSYLAELYLEKGYEVHGLVRRSSSFNTGRIDHIYDDLHLTYGDLADYGSIANWVRNVQPDHFLNMSAQSVAAKCRLPILSTFKVEHPTFEELWKRISGHHEVLEENIDGLKVEVINIETSKQIRALGFWNGMGSWRQIKQISRHYYKGKVAKLRQKFGEVTVTPNHSIYDVYGNLTIPEENPWLLNVRKINYRRFPFLEVFDASRSNRMKKDEVYCWHKEDKTTKMFRHLSSDKLTALCDFVGAFIAEGHTTYNKANGSFLVGISNQDLDWLKKIQKSLNKFYNGPSCFVRHKKELYKDVWELQIRSKTLHYWCAKNCGVYSINKKIPDLLLSCSYDNLKIMFDSMLFGDGCIDKRKCMDNSWRYGTISYKLACQISTLVTLLGYDYTVNINEQPPNNNTIYNFRQSVVYQPTQGAKSVIWEDYDGYVYDISVEDTTNFAVGVGNIVVHNSHVRVSFDIPEYTMDIGATGVIRCLEALSNFSPHTRFVQASTSELFGSSPPPQNEKTTFHPRSPYAAAKIAGYWSTVNYRETNKLFATNSISYNHECIAENTPIIVKNDGFITVCSAADLIPLQRKGRNIQSYDLIGKGVEIWDGNNWVELKTITATKRNKNEHDHEPRWTEARGGVVLTTNHHTMLRCKDNLEGYEECRADCLKTEDNIYLRNLPENICLTKVTEELAELLGLLASDGCIKDCSIQFTNNNEELIKRISFLWTTCFMGYTTTRNGKSGFSSNIVKQTYLNGCNLIIKWLRDQLYTYRKFKKVPDIILNASVKKQKAFLKGYYSGDALKVGNRESVKTNSPFLAQGICFLYNSCYNKQCSVYVEHRKDKTYYQLNIQQNKEHSLKKSPNEIRKTGVYTEGSEYFDDWVFDLETESGLFMAGVGRIVVHNSPRRGETFVTRKITRAATRIKLGLQDKLVLGNLDSKRDWNHAADVANAIYLMASASEADDWVVASGEMHSVKEFLELTFRKLDLDWESYVVFDDKYLRPTEVDALCGDSTKIRTKLGWKPKYSFDQLVDQMISEDLKLAEMEKKSR